MIIGACVVHNCFQLFNRTLDTIYKLCDVAVILDDGSTDCTFTERYNQVRLAMKEKPFSFAKCYKIQKEYERRNMLWQMVRGVAKWETKEENGDWICLIDADEIYHKDDIPTLRKLMEENQTIKHVCFISTVVHNMWSESQYRVDGYWGPKYGYKRRIFKFINTGQYKPINYNPETLECGEVPEYTLGLTGIDTNCKLLHLGYLTEAERLRKYNFHKIVDPEGKFHASDHIESIIKPATLERLTPSKKILLINPPSPFLMSDGDRPPLGLAYLASCLRNKGHDVKIFDFAVEDNNQLLNQILMFQPEIIGFTATTPVYPLAVDLLDKIKSIYPNFTSVIGGAHATVLPTPCLEYFEYVIRGEAEQTFCDFVDGISVDKIIESKNIENLDSIPFPARDLLPMSKYTMRLDNEICATIITSRGCPNRCVYCSNIHGRKFRARSAENVISEIKHIIDTYGIKSFYIMDDVFTLDKKRVQDICNGIRNLDIRFRVTTRIDLVNKEMLENLKSVGCTMVCYGLESGSDRVLNIYKKGFTVRDIKNAVETTKTVGLEMKAFWMHSEFETEQDRIDTDNLIKELNLKVNDVYKLTVYPGSELWNNKENKETHLGYFRGLYHAGK